MTFEGSYRADGIGLADDARLECGVCWFVYDPAAGDPRAAVLPGTPFARLPEHWSCPECDAPRHRFMAVSD